MENIKVEIVADSINLQGDRLTSMVLTYPRMIHAELLTHRAFSRNASSSRAVPVKKMIESVRNNTFCPIEFQKAHKGMQGSEYFVGSDKQECVNLWLESAELALEQAEKMDKKGISKQIINRILEPYQYYQVLVTATEWSNFFELRCPKFDYLGQKLYKSRKDAIKETNASLPYDDWYSWQKMNKSQAEIHIQALAEAMWDALNESTPNQLQAGEYHIPFGEKITDEGIWPFISHEDEIEAIQCKIAVARCARLSYNTHDGEINYEKDIKLHDQLLKDKHFSPFEHVARCMTTQEYYGHHLSQGNGNPFDNNGKDMYGVCNNFKGWIQYRYLVENETT